MSWKPINYETLNSCVRKQEKIKYIQFTEETVDEIVKNLESMNIRCSIRKGENNELTTLVFYKFSELFGDFVPLENYIVFEDDDIESYSPELFEKLFEVSHE